MNILIVNPGSTSYKCKLLSGTGTTGTGTTGTGTTGTGTTGTGTTGTGTTGTGFSVLFEAAVERIGEPRAVVIHRLPDHEAVVEEKAVDGYSAAIRLVLSLIEKTISLSSVTAVGFKVVLAKGITGCVELDDRVLEAMEEYLPLAPVHNAVYIAAVREMRKALPGVPLVGLFETAFHAQIPEEAFMYGVPREWHDKYGVRKYGFHGASHRYISLRAREIFLGNRERFKLISCHLGGSSSVCAIRDGISVDTSMGMSPQSGLLNAKRTGDFDSFALLYVMEKEGLSPEKAREILISRSGVFGLSGGSADFRDVIAKMWKGDRHAESAFKTFAYYVKRYIGEYIAVLDMPDLIVFTGGLGQNSPEMREASAGGMENLGIVLDEERNRTNPVEGLISTPESKIKVAVMQTNEELIVAEAVRGYMKEKRKIGIRG